MVQRRAGFSHADFTVLDGMEDPPILTVLKGKKADLCDEYLEMDMKELYDDLIMKICGEKC